MNGARWTSSDWLLPWCAAALAICQLVLARPVLVPSLFAIALLAWVPFRRSPLPSGRALPWLLAMPYAIWWIVEVSGGRQQAGPVQLVAIPAWYFGTLSIFQVLAGERSGAWRHWNALVAILLAGFVPDAPQWVAASAFCLVVLLGARTGGSSGAGRRFRPAWIPAIAGVAVLATLSSWTSLRIPGGGFDGRRWDGASRKGFSSTLRLGDGFGIDPSPSDDDVAVRVWSDGPPGSLKGAVFDTYVRGSWTRSEGWGASRTERNDLEYSVFCLVSDTLERMRGFAMASVPVDGFLLVPATSGCVGIVGDSIRSTSSGVWQFPDPALERGWKWFPGGLPARVLNAERKVPRLLEPFLDSLRVEAGLVDAPRDSVPRRISRWLSAGFRYSLRVRPAGTEEPLRVFARDREGFCEHFASMGALLTRRCGIPSRVVTGYASADLESGAWIYRRSSAHAWVELFDSTRGWTAWDPTPVAELPLAPRAPRWNRWSQGIGTRARRIWHLLRDGAWRGELELRVDDATARVGSWGVPGLVAGLLAAGVFAGWRLRRRRDPSDPVSELARRLARAEDRLRREGHVRFRGETVGQFLDRLPPRADATSRRELESYQDLRWRSRERTGNRPAERG